MSTDGENDGILSRQPDLFGLPIPMLPCRNCGSLFEVSPGAVGSPRVFCSLTCRHAHTLATERRWRAERVPGEGQRELSCRTCGSAFAIDAARRSGRLPRFCSEPCRSAEKRRRNDRLRSRRRRLPAANPKGTDNG